MRWIAIAVTGILSTQGLAQTGVYLERRPSSNQPERDAAKRAAVQAAQGEVDRMEALVAAARARIQATWKANPDMIAAERELAVKQSAYETAKAPVIAKLRDDPKYREAAAAATRAEQSVANAQSSTPPTTQPSPEQVGAATAKLEVKSDLRDMEEKALAADANAAKAKADLDAAREKIKAMQLQFDAVLLNDAEYKASLDQLNAARSRLTAAAGQN